MPHDIFRHTLGAERNFKRFGIYASFDLNANSKASYAVSVESVVLSLER